MTHKTRTTKIRKTALNKWMLTQNSLKKIEELEKILGQCQKEIFELMQLKRSSTAKQLPLVNIQLRGLSQHENIKLNSILNSSIQLKSIN